MQKYHLIDEEFVTFELDHQEYAVPKNKVLKTLGTEGIIDSDQSELCVLGAVYGKNHKVPVLDLRCLFGFEERTKKEDSLVLVAAFGPESIQIGFIVDSIGTSVPILAGFSEKDNISENDPREKYILGEVLVKGKTILLLNSDKCGQYLRSYSLV